MKKLERNRTEDQYIKEQHVVGKYLYYSDYKNESNIYYIFKCDGIVSNSPLVYNCSRCYYFTVPKNNNCKCFLYDGLSKITVSPKAQLFTLSFEEFVDTFKIFVKNDKKYPVDLPDKIIQDK